MITFLTMKCQINHFKWKYIFLRKNVIPKLFLKILWPYFAEFYIRTYLSMLSTSECKWILIPLSYIVLITKSLCQMKRDSTCYAEQGRKSPFIRYLTTIFYRNTLYKILKLDKMTLARIDWWDTKKLDLRIRNCPFKSIDCPLLWDISYHPVYIYKTCVHNEHTYSIKYTYLFYYFIWKK